VVSNRTTADTAIAIMAREPLNPSDWVLKGWLRVEPGQCKKGGTYLKGTFFFVANSPIRQWNGADTPLCVEAAPFRKIHNRPQYCLAPHRLKMFTRVAVGNDRFTVNLS
jgi:hypothetical protein